MKKTLAIGLMASLVASTAFAAEPSVGIMRIAVDEETELYSGDDWEEEPATVENDDTEESSEGFVSEPEVEEGEDVSDGNGEELPEASESEESYNKKEEAPKINTHSSQTGKEDKPVVASKETAPTDKKDAAQGTLPDDKKTTVEQKPDKKDEKKRDEKKPAEKIDNKTPPDISGINPTGGIHHTITVGSQKKVDEKSTGLSLILECDGTILTFPVSDLLLCPDEAVFKDFSLFISDTTETPEGLSLTLLSTDGSASLSIKRNDPVYIPWMDSEIIVTFVDNAAKTAEPSSPVKDEGKQKKEEKPDSVDEEPEPEESYEDVPWELDEDVSVEESEVESPEDLTELSEEELVEREKETGLVMYVP